MMRNALIMQTARSALVCSIFFGLTYWSSASEVKVATTKPTDVFLVSLQRSSSLARANIKIIVETVPKEKDALNAVLDGSAEIGLFTFNTLSDRKFDNQPTLFSVFTEPFIFSYPKQIYRIENTPLGDAVLADVARIGVTPLGYWNRGLTQILAKQPLTSPEDFRGITIGGWATTFGDNGATPILISLGANAKVTTDYVAELENGTIGGTIWEPLSDGKLNVLESKNIPLRAFATEFQPIVGVVASSASYWNTLSTAQKAAWDTAINEANNLSAIEIDKSSSLNSKYSKPVALSGEQILLVSSALPDEQRFVKDYKLLKDAETFISSSQQNTPFKKKAN